MLDGLIEDDFAVQVADELMNVRDNSAIRLSFEAQRLDDRVDQIPLARPVFADTLMAADSAAFHAVGPIHIGMQKEQQKIQVALVESIVRGEQQILVVERWSFACHVFIPLEIMRQF